MSIRLGALLLAALCFSAPLPCLAAEQDAPTAEEVRAQVRELLDELDSFRGSRTFRECVYGCGKKNPGSGWDAKRQALQDRITPQLPMPPLLKAAPGELWMLGMAYAKGEEREAKDLRADIEEALEQ